MLLENKAREYKKNRGCQQSRLTPPGGTKPNIQLWFLPAANRKEVVRNQVRGARFTLNLPLKFRKINSQRDPLFQGSMREDRIHLLYYHFYCWRKRENSQIAETCSNEAFLPTFVCIFKTKPLSKCIMPRGGQMSWGWSRGFFHFCVSMGRVAPANSATANRTLLPSRVAPQTGQ